MIRELKRESQSTLIDATDQEKIMKQVEELEIMVHDDNTDFLDITDNKEENKPPLTLADQAKAILIDEPVPDIVSIEPV